MSCPRCNCGCPPMTDLERMVDYTRRKEIYDSKFPKCKSQRVELANETDTEVLERRKPFADVLAEETGRSVTSIREELKLGQAVLSDLSPQVRELIASTPIANNKAEIKRILEEPDEEVQLELARLLNNHWHNKRNSRYGNPNNV